jgi:hypothetical protein
LNRNPSPLSRKISRNQKSDQNRATWAVTVFLCQWLGGFLAYLAWSGAPARGWGLTLCALPIILLLSAALAWAHQLFVEPLRARIRTAPPQRLAPPWASQAPAE